MTQITLDAAAADKLNAIEGIVELCDPSGKVLGRFTPAFNPSEWVPISDDVSEEELDRREQSTEWYTTEQVVAHLKGLEEQ
jgi:hypothetical protein